ncbi:probable serine/threonine-protein kinase At1g54610 [Salvia miltiorrhiza]|uniref:probable serine/threonine-protein kinase At1g54610 n=1 Tax=Salvia miltiorrhiza TaxID=226208 RepID=UPI0025ABDDEA|nr:probable serine/threonine-protein kinase At1g54610 [Salvia miltiorrhiza]
MGCVCGKPSSAVEDSEVSPKQRDLIRKASELRLARGVSSRRNESFSLKESLENGDVKIGLIDKKVSGSRKVRDDYYEKRKGSCEDLGGNFPSLGSLPRAVEGEQVAAGWPSWLVAVAGEAIRGWTPRKADTFEKLDKIGQGTYSSVYKGRDLLTNKYVALKKVRFDNMDPESVKFMAREILILRRLDHPNIIKLEGLVTSRTSSSLYLVFEYMEHDLTGLASLPGVRFTEPQVKCYMKQLLSGLDYCHSNGVLHRDIKGSNLLINNHGVLKIADFGLASYFDNHNKIPLTSRVVTLWYRPPELLLGATQYGVAVDLWSAGCILGELYAGKPIMPGRTEVEQLHKIFKLCGSPSEDYWRKSKLPHSPVFKPIQPYRRRIADTFKDRHDAAVRLMEILLSVDPSDRGTAASALESEFFKTNPVACDPSSLPKYPPSKEIDAKLREEEARRKGAAGAKGHKGENDSKKSRELRTVAGLDPNTELARLMPRRHGHVDSKSRSEFFNTQKADAASGLAMDQSERAQVLSERSKDLQNPRERVISNSGPLAPPVSWTPSGKKNDDVPITSARNGLPSAECRDSLGSQHVGATNQAGRFSQSFGEAVRKHDRRRASQILQGTQQADYGRIISTKETVLEGHGQKERKIHFSGPLLAPSNNIEQVLKEHDCRIQEAARRLKNEKTRGGRVRPHETHPSAKQTYVSTESAG